MVVFNILSLIDIDERCEQELLLNYNYQTSYKETNRLFVVTII